MSFEPYMVNSDTVAISKEDYENCRSWHLITNAKPVEELLADKGLKKAEKGMRKMVCYIEAFHEHPETGSGWVRGYCPHCGRYIDKSSSMDKCDYCFGAIMWR